MNIYHAFTEFEEYGNWTYALCTVFLHAFIQKIAVPFPLYNDREVYIAYLKINCEMKLLSVLAVSENEQFA